MAFTAYFSFTRKLQDQNCKGFIATVAEMLKLTAIKVAQYNNLW